MVRSATKKDLKKIYKLRQKVFKYHGTIEELEEQLFSEFEHYYVITSPRNRFLGYAHFRIVEEQAEVFDFAIKPSKRNKGLGKELFLNALDDVIANKGVKTVTLEVRQSNLAAQHIYHLCGFDKISVRKKYYKDEDGYLYILKVK